MAVAQTNDFREAQAQRNSATPSVSKETPPQFNTGVFSQDTHPSIAEELVVEEKPPAIQDYDKIVTDLVGAWVANSEKIGDVVGEQVWSLVLG